MRERLEQRVKELHLEYEAGQKVLAELDDRQANIQKTLLRISGAIQVLEEELGNADETMPKETAASGAGVPV